MSFFVLFSSRASNARVDGFIVLADGPAVGRKKLSIIKMYSGMLSYARPTFFPCTWRYHNGVVRVLIVNPSLVQKNGSNVSGAENLHEGGSSVTLILIMNTEKIGNSEALVTELFSLYPDAL